MPLSKERMRERKRQDRAGVKPVVKPTESSQTHVKPSITQLQTLIHTIEDKKPVQPTVQPVNPIPWYNSEIHTTGDTVRMKVGNSVQVVTL